MKKFTLMFVCIMMFSSTAYADYRWSKSSDDQGSSGIGIIAGSTYGLGFGFRHQFKNSPVGIQVGGFPLMKKDEGLFTAGAGLQFTLHTGNYGRAFLSLSGSVMHAYNGGLGTVPEGEDYTLYSVGPGVGIEFKFTDNFSFVLDVPAAAFFDSNDGFVGMLPIPNTSFMFTW